MPPFRDEHILVISPGSRTTIAQLGLPESLTPPKFRIPSRMFPCGPGKYSFHKIREAREGEKDGLAQHKSGQQQQDGDDEEDDEEDDEDDTQKPGETPGAIKEQPEVKDSKPEETRIHEPDEMEEDAETGPQLVEDLEDEEGAVWCMGNGRVVDWRAFFAMLHYVYETLNPTFHTPILLVHPPEFTRADKERVTQFIFEKLKAPGLALLDAAVAGLWAYGLATATVVDVGFSKTSITPLADFIIQERARKTLDNCGGETMTQHLCSLLPDMKPEWVETLKKSPICEILPPGMPTPGSGEVGSYVPVDEEDINMLGEDEGTINVAAIVASGKTKEFLAQKEKEKRGEAERKLPNRERESNYFWVVDKRLPGEVDSVASTLTSPITAEGPGFPALVADGAAAPETQEGQQQQVAILPAPSTSTSPTSATFPQQDPEKAHKESEKRKQTRLAESQGIHLKPTETWRELSVGTERFCAAEGDLLQRIADGIYDSVQHVEEIGKRAEMWDNIIIVGNGSKVKGFKDALLHTLHSKHLIPPSSGTIFSSSLPSGTSTPLGTPGASTPLPNHPNPLLVAATTGNFQHQQHPYHPHQTFHSQSPASIKLAKIPEYFPEWKDVGFEDAHFLGAQVAAKVVFVVDQGANRGFIGRVEYNEMGPEGIHDATV